MDNIHYDEFRGKIKQKCSNPEYAKYIDDFVQQGLITGIITEKNLYNVLDKLQKIDTFTELPMQYRGNYGGTFPSQDRNGLIVMVNPDLPQIKREQYAFHELAHVVMDGEADFIKNNVIETMRR